MLLSFTSDYYETKEMLYYDICDFRHMSAAFQKALLSTAFHVSHDNRIISELSNITDSSGETVVLMLGRCLPHIVPNVLIAKREVVLLAHKLLYMRVFDVTHAITSADDAITQISQGTAGYDG